MSNSHWERDRLFVLFVQRGLWLMAVAFHYYTNQHYRRAYSTQTENLTRVYLTEPRASGIELELAHVSC